MIPNIRMYRGLRLFGWLMGVNFWFDYDAPYYKLGWAVTWRKSLVEQ
jgi:hypothetical protein